MDPTNPTPNDNSGTPPATPPATPPVTPPAGSGAFAQVSADGTTPPAPVPLAERIPEKLRVMREDGTLDVDASLAKVAEGYTNLEKRFGTGDVPPKTPEEYAPKVEGLDFEELKTDEKYQGFLKGAHAKGLTNAQVEWVLGEYSARLGSEGEVATLGMTTAEFQQAMETEWKDAGGYQAGMTLAMRTLRTYGGELTAEELATIPNNPLVAKVLAAVGKELPEDSGTPRAGQLDVADWETQVANLKASEAYNNATHAEHKKAVAQVTALYEKRYPKK